VPLQHAGTLRHDGILGYSVGLGRPLTRWCFVRADYHRDERTSDIPGLSTKTYAFTGQVGLGYVASGVTR
jgi:hypothetical protein